MVITYRVNVYCLDKCPVGLIGASTNTIMVGSAACSACEYSGGHDTHRAGQEGKFQKICNHPKLPANKEPESLFPAIF